MTSLTTSTWEAIKVQVHCENLGYGVERHNSLRLCYTSSLESGVSRACLFSVLMMSSRLKELL